MAYGSVKMCLQCATCSMVSTCLFRALRFLSYRDSRVQKEACQWPKGKTLRLEIPGAKGFTVTGTEVEVAFVPSKLPVWAFCAGGAALLVLLLLLVKRIRSKRGPKGGKPEKEKAPRKEKKGRKAAVDASAPADELDTPISETDVP